MPFDKRLDYAIQYCLLFFAGYSLPLLATVVLMLLFSVEQIGSLDIDDYTLSGLLMVTGLIVFSLGAAALLGAMGGAVLFPVAVVRRVYWAVCLLLGWGLAKGSLLLLVLTEAVELGPVLYLANLVLGFIMAVLAGTLGLSISWCRRWYPSGRCQACGYDLRVTPPGMPCPECGEPRPKPNWAEI